MEVRLAKSRGFCFGVEDAIELAEQAVEREGPGNLVALGPVIHNPIREARDVDRVRELDDLSSLEFTMETVRQTRAGLSPEIPLIGFAGAPFTLASYMIEGGASRNYLHAKRLMYADTGAWNELMTRLVRATVRYLNAQIAAGAQAVQVFD